MQFAVLGSGSRGNATIIRCGQTTLLVDNGFSGKELERRLASIGCGVEHLDAILVTHEHSDHIGGVGVVSRRFQLPVWMTQGTAGSSRLGAVNELNIIDQSADFSIGDINVLAVPVMHDAREPCQFIFSHGQIRLGMLTDLGCVDDAVFSAYQRCTSLILEANYDEQLLARGPYPAMLKQRVGGRYGHLSNRQTADFLSLHHSQSPGVLKMLVMAHISEKNNTTECVKAALEPVVADAVTQYYAQQEHVLGFIDAH
ncbi:Putative metallo-hydrolase YycJ [Sinobacterium norvegicum]|uniref:Metallo-hydrolase YycJ n=1 Tax=Sinobacterium norvegicum TaxID=1641715 RepID=A0ABN8EE27_9GAMM|nr:MBL fold metallo-hydrolase [Sinobacterium norvegicum]CAH0990481.1 Putative metallo-hydrolase YycJ [Sinobacterium norvegicum]